MAYSASHQRLYLGYHTGAIRYINVNAASPVEVAFASMTTAVKASRARVISCWHRRAVATTVATCSTAPASPRIKAGYYYGYSRETAWDPVTSRVYYFRDGISPNDLHYDVIDQTTGLIDSAGESPYHDSFSFYGPIRVSADGSQILLGSGEFFAGSGLARTGSLGKAIADAQWKDNLLIDVDTTDLVEIRDANSRTVLQSYQYLGQPMRVVFGPIRGVPGARHEWHDGIRALAFLRPGWRHDVALVGAALRLERHECGRCGHRSGQ